MKTRKATPPLDDLLHRVQAIEIGLQDCQLNCEQYRIALSGVKRRLDALVESRRRVLSQLLKKKD